MRGKTIGIIGASHIGFGSTTEAAKRIADSLGMSSVLLDGQDTVESTISKTAKANTIQNKIDILLAEYQLISRKESKLSSNKRKEVVMAVDKLIADGYLKVRKIKDGAGNG